MKTHVVKAGDSFERHVPVSAPCAFSFGFTVDQGSLEFGVFLRNAKGKDTRLLSQGSYSELSGEVLLPGPGTCIARWHNPSGWLWSSNATLHYKLSCVKPQAPATSSQPERVAKKAKAAVEASSLAAPAAEEELVEVEAAVEEPVEVGGDAEAEDYEAGEAVEEDAAEEDAADAADAAEAAEAADAADAAEAVTSPTLDSKERKMLERRLETRPSRESLESTGILRGSRRLSGSSLDPSLIGPAVALQDNLAKASLGRALANRPGAQELASRGILRGISSEGASSAALVEKRASLSRAMTSDSLRRALDKRPTADELKERSILLGVRWG